MSRRPLVMVSLDPDPLDLVEDMEEFELVGVFDANPDCDTGGVSHLGPDENWEDLRARLPGLAVAMALDPTGVKAARVALFGRDNLATVIAPDAWVSPKASLGPGCIVQRGAKILRNARLGSACKVNVDAAVHHDCDVGDCCTLAPGARLLGSVAIGDRVYVGAGALVLPGCAIGADATVGAGAVVTKNVPAGASVAGVPARAAG